jgi:hypothetical protein
MQTPTTHVFSVYPFKKTGNTEEYDTTPLYTGVDAAVVPASTDILAVYPGISSFQLNEIFIYENVDLKNGYKLVSGSEEYVVRGQPMKVDNAYMYYTHVVGERVI